MKTLTYLFWRFWKFRVKKESGDESGAYLTATMLFGVFFVSFPLMLLVSKLFTLPKITENKVSQYLLVIPLVFLCSLPIRLIFPKKKILSLEYSNEERKHYKYNFYRFIIILSILITIRYLHMKGHFDGLF